MIFAPSVMSRVVTAKTAAAALPEGQLSNIPWRKMGVHHNPNEVYFDFIEGICVHLYFFSAP